MGKHRCGCSSTSQSVARAYGLSLAGGAIGLTTGEETYAHYSRNLRKLRRPSASAYSLVWNASTGSNLRVLLFDGKEELRPDTANGSA